jgi:hypothetical protein
LRKVVGAGAGGSSWWMATVMVMQCEVGWNLTRLDIHQWSIGNIIGCLNDK